MVTFVVDWTDPTEVLAIGLCVIAVLRAWKYGVACYRDG